MVPPEPMKEGDIVRLDYQAWVAGEAEDLLQTTDEDLAREHDIYDGGRVYGPVPVILGSSSLVAGLEEAVLKAEVGVEETVEVPPEKGYGARDPEDVQIMSRREFRRMDIDPEPGMEVTIRNRRGRIISVTPGRVRVDFNPPLAGKTLRYVFTVADHLTEPADQVEAVLAAVYHRGHAEDFEVHVDEETARIVVPDIAKFDPAWFEAKAEVVDKIRTFAGVREVVFIEEHALPAGAEPEEADAVAEAEGEGDDEADDEEPAEGEDEAEAEAPDEDEADAGDADDEEE